MQTTDDARTRAIFRLGTKLIEHTAGLDPHDAAVMIVEVPSPDRAGWLDLIGETLVTHPFTKASGETCTRVRAIIEADVRMLLRLDLPGAPTINDAPLGSRAAPLTLAPPPATTAYARRGTAERSVR